MQYLFQNLVNLRRLAVANRLTDDSDIEMYIERAYRYYSKTYNCDLFELKKKLAPEEVVLVFMEDEMEEWTIEEVIKIKNMLDNSERPVLDAKMADRTSDDISDDEWIAEQNKLIAKQEAEEKKRKQNEDIAKKTHKVIEELTQSFKSLTKTVEKKPEE